MASANLKVRQAGLHDVDIVLGILDEAAGWLKQREIPSVWKPGGFSRQSFLAQISHGEVYVALVDDTAAGTFILQWSDSPFWGERPPDSGYIHKLAVRPDFAGRGIGREMLRWAEARRRVRARGFSDSTAWPETGRFETIMNGPDSRIEVTLSSLEV